MYNSLSVLALSGKENSEIFAPSADYIELASREAVQCMEY